MAELDRLAEKLHTPHPVKQHAAMIYRKALDKNLIRGRSIDGAVAASLYATCRLTHLPKSVDEIAAVSTRSKKEIAQIYRLIVWQLQIKMSLHDPLDSISKIAETVGLSGEIQGRAVRLLRNAQLKGLTAGKNPRGIAAAVLYIASKQAGQEATQREIAKAAGVSEVTLRNRRNGLRKGLKLNM
jgi:transcription initiation factor TFIIB